MNTCIQTLNHWGEMFLSFAWPMLWQSSVLIGLVLAFDALLARRIRAAIRYALWMVMLVKLLLPPALALPTGAAWWLWPAKQSLVPVMKSEVVTFDAPVTLPPVSVTQTNPFVPPPPELSGAGWAMLVWVVVGAALMFWLAIRWLRIAAKVRRARDFGDFDFVPGEPAPCHEPSPSPLPSPPRGRGRSVVSGFETMDTSPNSGVQGANILWNVLLEACRLAGLRRCPRLKLVDDVQSPAVYGLFRPVILLPCALVEKLSPRQLRAVLLHEAIHLRRGDVWVHCAQTLLQIAYWWHPLLWLANARIRRAREEAVDDAVMLALRQDAYAYAPTLLEVAKFSFRRPLAGLALVGILESRSALRRRIERLVDFVPPRKTGLTFMSFLGIFVFSAVALPMGQGPAPTNAPSPNDPVQGKLAYENGLSRQVASALNQALAEERKEAHLDLVAQAKINNSQMPFGPVIDPATDLPISASPPSTSINPDDLKPEEFHIGTAAFYAAIRKLTDEPDVIIGFKELAANAGVDLSPPKQIFLSEGMGLLFVKATTNDLKTITDIIAKLSCPPPMVHIKARFIEVPKKFFAANSLPVGFTNGGVLPNPDFQILWHEIQEQNGSEELAEPEVTTMPGREAQMRATIIEPVLADDVFDVLTPHHVLDTVLNTNWQNSQSIEIGPILDVVPMALADGYTLSLGVTASDRKFFGYAATEGVTYPVQTNFNGRPVERQALLPAVQDNRATTQKTLYDGQTLVLFPAPKQVALGVNDEKTHKRIADLISKSEMSDGDKVLVVFITATLRDAAGNRVHSDEEMPFAQNGVPPPWP